MSTSDQHSFLYGASIKRGLVQTGERLQTVLGMLTYRPVPTWLGDFRFKVYGRAYGKDFGKPPTEIGVEALRLAEHCPDQSFTTVFVQVYRPGENVKPHRDPKNNVGHTVIGLYGEFSETRLRIGDHWFEQRSGDVFLLPCTITGVQGPEHEMRWAADKPATGLRYAIIINRITP